MTEHTSIHASIKEGKLIDKVYSAYLVAWYTMFAIQGVPNIPDKFEVNIDTVTGTHNFKKMYEHNFQNGVEDVVKKLAMISCCSTFLKETFRMTQEYCNKNDLTDKLFSESWYHFAKILVNCLSHDMVFSFQRLNPKHLPAHYADISITTDMEGEHMSEKFTAQIFLNLGTDIGIFVAEEIEGLADGTKGENQ